MSMPAPLPIQHYAPVDNYPPAPAPPVNYGAYNNAYQPCAPYPPPGPYPYNAPRSHYGIGGWLVLPAIGVVLAPLMVIYLLIQGVIGLGQLEAITRTGLDIPIKGMRTATVIELLVNSMLLIFAIILAVQFFRKRSVVPALYITFLFANMVFGVLDYILAESTLTEFMTTAAAETGDKGLLKELDDIKLECIQLIMRSTLACAIWVPYFLRSKRVKATFIH
jgi:phosphotransferase system  glucose/maltose/N-acetylglucosamine-specific IIC component